jgi:hypothetical protein
MLRLRDLPAGPERTGDDLVSDGLGDLIGQRFGRHAHP